MLLIVLILGQMLKNLLGIFKFNLEVEPIVYYIQTNSVNALDYQPGDIVCCNLGAATTHICLVVKKNQWMVNVI